MLSDDGSISEAPSVWLFRSKRLCACVNEPSSDEDKRGFHGNNACNLLDIPRQEFPASEDASNFHQHQQTAEDHLPPTWFLRRQHELSGFRHMAEIISRLIFQTQTKSSSNPSMVMGL